MDCAPRSQDDEGEDKSPPLREGNAMSNRRQQSGAGPLTGLLTMLAVAVVVVLAGLGTIYLVAGGSGSDGPQTMAPASTTTGDQPEQMGTSQDSGTLPDYVLS